MSEPLTVQIEDWFITSSDDVYTAPECRTKQICGRVFGHPNFADGSQITSSEIISIEFPFVQTRNTRYKTGTPSLGYIEWCKENGYINAIPS